jgi:hypothetical protein
MEVRVGPHFKETWKTKKCQQTDRMGGGSTPLVRQARQGKFRPDLEHPTPPLLTRELHFNCKSFVGLRVQEN